MTESSIPQTESNTPTVDPPQQETSTPEEPTTESSVVVAETTTSNGVTLTVSRTIAPHATTARSNTASTAASLEEDGDDAVALVYPWDPRIQYSPDGAWVSTSSSSSIGNCNNGTKVATKIGASISFNFEGAYIFKSVVDAI